MNKLERKALARKFGSVTGKLKKKHIVRAKFYIRGEDSITKLTEREINTLIGEVNE